MRRLLKMFEAFFTGILILILVVGVSYGVLMLLASILGMLLVPVVALILGVAEVLGL